MLIYCHSKVVNMSAITAYANRRNVFDTGSLDPYLQQAQPRKPIIPEWATNQVDKYATRTATATSLATAGYALGSGLTLGAAATGLIGLGIFGFLFGGLARAGYNLLRHYKIF